MKLAEKIINLRRTRGFSQEELADRLDVTRQSVSKWESGQSVPDTDRIVALSRIFGVSTDYLLKEELEAEEEPAAAPSPASEEASAVSGADAEAYLAVRRRAAGYIALGVLLCVFAPIPLLLLGVLSDGEAARVPENLAALIGLIVLFGIVAAAVVLFIRAETVTKPYLHACEGELCTDAAEQMRRRMAEHSPRYNRTNLIATLLCILSPVPLLVCVFLTENVLPIMLSLAVTMLAAGIGAALYILVGVPHAAMQRLLREGEYAPGAPRLYSAVRTAYWLLVLGVFLAWSFLGNAWHISWTVWAVAGILSGALEAILGAVGKRK